MVEAIIGNANHLRKFGSLHYSCEVLVLMRPNAYQLLSNRWSNIIPDHQIKEIVGTLETSKRYFLSGISGQC
jgi:hypothetical protein